jgi:hypothetical protein
MLTQPPNQLPKEAFSRGLGGRGVKLTTHLRPMPRLRMSGTLPPLPSIFVALTGTALSCTNICQSLQQFSLTCSLIIKKQSRCLSVRAAFLRICNHIHKLLRVAFIMLASIDYSCIYTNKACSRNNFKNSPTPVNSPTSIILLFQMSRWWEHTGREVRCNK